MGFFSKEEDNSTVPPNKLKRKLCWDARDEFFECLTKNNIDNSLGTKELEIVNSQCSKQKKQFENNCVASWVKYFQEKRFNDLTRQRYIDKLEAEGAKPLPFQLDNSRR